MEQTFIYIGMYIVSIVLAYIILFCAYEIEYIDGKYVDNIWISAHTSITKKRYKRPLWMYLAISAAVCVPIVNIMSTLVTLIITHFDNDNYVYKSIFNKRI